MKETLAKGGKIEKNMKKQSILNLVNSILLLCTLLFSVISFAWYSNTVTIKPDLSFGAKSISQLENLWKLYFDDAQSQVRRDTEIETLGSALNPETDYSSVSYDTFEMGVIDDLGYLKDTNCVYYCLPIDKSYNEVLIDLSYVAEGTNHHFTLQNEELDLITDDTLTTAAGYEEFDPSKDGGVHTYVIYDCALSTISPEQISHDEIHSLFGSTSSAPIQRENMVSAPGYDPEGIDADNVSLSPTGMTISGNTYYVYIRVYPNLSNYEKLAMLMLDNMPFYLAFNLKLYIGLPGATN